MAVLAVVSISSIVFQLPGAADYLASNERAEQQAGRIHRFFDMWEAILIFLAMLSLLATLVSVVHELMYKVLCRRTALLFGHKPPSLLRRITFRVQSALKVAVPDGQTEPRAVVPRSSNTSSSTTVAPRHWSTKLLQKLMPSQCDGVEVKIRRTSHTVSARGVTLSTDVLAIFQTAALRRLVANAAANDLSNLVRVNRDVGDKFDETCDLGYLSVHPEAIFYRRLANAFPELIDILCLETAEQSEERGMKRLQHALAFLCQAFQLQFVTQASEQHKAASEWHHASILRYLTLASNQERLRFGSLLRLVAPSERLNHQFNWYACCSVLMCNHQ